VITVVGGTGMVGSRVVKGLAGSGREVRILSRRKPERLATGVSHETFDMGSDDPAPLLAGSEVLIDLANSPGRPKKVLVEGTSRLLEACETQAVGHYVGISIVGCEQIGLGYYRAKARQEDLIRSSPVPWSLLQATQFHEFVDDLLGKSARLGLLPAGDIRLQPIAASEAAGRLCEIALELPLNGSQRLVGPETSTLGELGTAWKDSNGRRVVSLPLPLPGRTGSRLREGALTDPDAPSAGPAFGEWLRR
jgi:uncharacterized protein YbjT (DUF2867 family)